jgi:uncharacterized protein
MTDVDRAGRSPLHYAAVNDDLDAAEAELARGADVGLQDHQGMTPLHAAAQQGSVNVARVLLARGAPVDSVDQWGNTPLWRAVFNKSGDPALIQMLLDAGADPDRLNAAGNSPRGLAAKLRDLDLSTFVGHE